MKDEKLEKYIAKDSVLIVDAMKKIEKNNKRTLYVIDSKRKLVGCITDGDIRRWIIGGGPLESYIGDAMNKTPMYISNGNKREAYIKMAEHQIDSIAIVDDELHIIDIVFSSSDTMTCEKNDTLINTAVIIMAGGKGTRLHPFTKILPKPLIPVGDIPIVERVMDSFTLYGVNEFYMTVNYKKEMIKSYFADTRFSKMIHYVEETEPLGTAGGIKLIDTKLMNPVIVTNCDTLIDADYGDIISHHKRRSNDLTIVSSLKKTIIPYGVLKTKDDGVVIDLKEKPRILNFINTGMYVVDPDYFNWIPKGEFFHMTDLAELMIKSRKQVGIYPISENSFLDMGQFEELKNMEEWICDGAKG